MKKRIPIFWLDVWRNRPDLQRVYPQVPDGDFSSSITNGNFIDWIKNYGRIEYNKEIDDDEIISVHNTFQKYNNINCNGFYYHMIAPPSSHNNILIASPLHSNNRIFFKRWFSEIKKITFNKKGIDILFVENSTKESFFTDIQQITKNHDNVTLYRMIPYDENNKQKTFLAQVMEFIKHYTLSHKYSHLLIIESDVFVKSSVAGHLIAHSLPVVSAIVQYHESSNLMAGIFSESPGDKLQYVENLKIALHPITSFSDIKLLKYDIGSLGCCLIQRDVLEKIVFRAYENYNYFHDTYFGIDCYNFDIPCYIDTSIKTLHFKRAEDWKRWEEEVDKFYSE